MNNTDGMKMILRYKESNSINKIWNSGLEFIISRIESVLNRATDYS